MMLVSLDIGLEKTHIHPGPIFYCTILYSTVLYYTVHVCITECLICFEAWAKLGQKWLMCVPLEIHLDPINKEVMLLVTIYS